MSNLYIYDDRNKANCIGKKIEILYENNEYMLIKIVFFGKNDNNSQDINEPLLINKKNGNVLNVDYYSFLLTEDENFIKEIRESFRDNE